MPRIVVFGLYKTGTTALYSNIRNSLSYEPRQLFESRRYMALPEDTEQGVLAKVIVAVDHFDADSFLNFEKKVLIIRDPRDWIISYCLFNIREIPEIYNNSKRYQGLLRLIKQKEESPELVDFLEICSMVVAFTHVKDLLGLSNWIRKLHYRFIQFEVNLPDGFRIKYEDFVDRKITGLSEYLSNPINSDVSVHSSYAHVPRSKAYGNWKNWFTHNDLKFFNPIFEPFMNRYGYDINGKLAVRPIIDPELGSKYVRRIV